MKVAYVFSTSGHTASYKLGKMILPQLEQGIHGAEVVGMMFFDDNTYLLRAGDPMGERLAKSPPIKVSCSCSATNARLNAAWRRASRAACPVRCGPSVLCLASRSVASRISMPPSPATHRIKSLRCRAIGYQLLGDGCSGLLDCSTARLLDSSDEAVLPVGCHLVTGDEAEDLERALLSGQEVGHGEIDRDGLTGRFLIRGLKGDRCHLM